MDESIIIRSYTYNGNHHYEQLKKECQIIRDFGKGWYKHLTKTYKFFCKKYDVRVGPSAIKTRANINHNLLEQNCFRQQLKILPMKDLAILSKILYFKNLNNDKEQSYPFGTGGKWKIKWSENNKKWILKNLSR